MAVWAVGLAILGLLACWLGRRQRIVTSQGWWQWTTGEEVKEHSPRGKGNKQSLVGDCQWIFKPSALALALLKSLGKSPDLEAWQWCWKTWPYLQTATQLLWPPDHPLEFARDHLQVADNGLVALDWVIGPWGESGKGPSAAESTVLLVVPSATGKITRNICQLCQLALEKGYYPVIFNRHGHNGCPLTSARLQPFGDPSDLKEAVAYIRFRHPTAMLFAVSKGSGSGLLLSYLGECGSSCDLHGAACTSSLLKGQDWFEAGSPWLCEWALLLYQKRVISRYTEALRGVVEMERVLGSHSLQEFEEALFCGRKSQPMTWEAYWRCNEPLRDADDVAVPVLCVCSADDPVRGPSSRTLPWELFCTNPHFFLLLAPHGGHCGFLQKSSLPSAASWGNTVALEYLGVLAKFFQADEGMRERPRRRRSAILYQHGQGVRQNRETLPASLDSQESFSWQRSYTR
ncbi:PREDICTED: abhydrolase domain-containing protein 15 [Gekko japonicus]|uniref:Abhydrolase domain-containing protein 15 n=1 Tax=Gekko japonicus TaxID=146911 RepID=A0ABM1KUX7_GEKJA|nr:PREDICTED: abhydrolase domain-containing protein 15 [Gekko japonicus]